ncbi:MAG TPA: isoamylase early set domain-containing protein [Thermomicrobiaceae bacterium]|nr:isoamylase early set domain-containing protein [Thermomicrobiaceae bacterium]
MIEKTFTRTGRSCRVTFELPAGTDAASAAVVGDFNGWDEQANPMRRKRDGSFDATVSLKPGQCYHFRYVLDGDRWDNDPAADAYAPNPFGGEDSVLDLAHRHQ